MKASAVREAVSAALKEEEQKSQRSTPQQAVAAEKGKSKRSTPQQLEAAEKAKSKRSTPEPLKEKPEGKRRLVPVTDETDEPLHLVTITNAKEPPRSYLQGCSCDRSSKPLKHQKRLLVEFSLRKDGANYVGVSFIGVLALKSSFFPNSGFWFLWGGVALMASLWVGLGFFLKVLIC